MSVVAWVFSGLIAACLARKVVKKQEEDFLLDIALGIAGAIIGGCFFLARTGAAGLAQFDTCSMLVALVGALAVLALYHAVFDRIAAKIDAKLTVMSRAHIVPRAHRNASNAQGATTAP